MTDLVKIEGCGGGCSDCKNSPSDSHTCPYQKGVNNDSEYECTCCEDCEHECAMDI